MTRRTRRRLRVFSARASRFWRANYMLSLSAVALAAALAIGLGLLDGGDPEPTALQQAVLPTRVPGTPTPPPFMLPNPTGDPLTVTYYLVSSESKTALSSARS
jgi:hypothetical protein